METDTVNTWFSSPGNPSPSWCFLDVTSLKVGVPLGRGRLLLWLTTAIRPSRPIFSHVNNEEFLEWILKRPETHQECEWRLVELTRKCFVCSFAQSLFIPVSW